MAATVGPVRGALRVNYLASPGQVSYLTGVARVTLAAGVGLAVTFGLTEAVVQPAFIAATGQVFGPTMSGGSLDATIEPSFIVATSAVHASMVKGGAATISPAVVAAVGQVYQPTLGGAAIGVAPSFTSSVAEVFEPTMFGTGPSIGPDYVDQANQIFQPTLAGGSTSVAPASIAASDNVHQPVLSPGGAGMTPGIISPSGSFPNPTIGAGAVAIAPATIAATGSVYQPAVSRLWTPADLTTKPTYWYDVADTATITHASGVVSALANRGSAGGSLSATGTEQPTYSTTGFPGSLPGITSDGSTDVLRQTGQAVANFGGSGRNTTTVVEAWKYTSGVVRFQIQATGSRVSAEGANRWDYPSGNAGDQWTTVDGDTSASVKVYHSDGSNKNVWRDGTVDSDGPKALSGATLANATHDINFFRSNTGTSFGASVMGEWMLFNYALSQTQREQCEGYLAHKWGLAGNLPGGHPYKSAAPRTP